MNPYNWQEHLYSKNQPENLEFLRRLRAVMEPYNAAAVGEVGDAQRGLEIMGQYTAGNDLMHMCYAFELLSGDRPSAAYIAEVMERVAKVAADGWACWAYSNHDVTRHTTRWDLNPAAERAFITLLMCLRGSACIYQGEELGLKEATLDFADLRDPYGIEFWPEYKGRDGCRTPMVWEASNQNGGFSTAARTWLPVPSDHLRHSVAAAEADPASLIHHYRRAIGLRHAHPALRQGEMRDIEVSDKVLSFLRVTADETIFCAFNLSHIPAEITLPKGDWFQIATELNSAHPGADGIARLGPWQPCIALRAG